MVRRNVSRKRNVAGKGKSIPKENKDSTNAIVAEGLMSILRSISKGGKNETPTKGKSRTPSKGRSRTPSKGRRSNTPSRKGGEKKSSNINTVKISGGCGFAALNTVNGDELHKSLQYSKKAKEDLENILNSDKQKIHFVVSVRSILGEKEKEEVSSIIEKKVITGWFQNKKFEITKSYLLNFKMKSKPNKTDEEGNYEPRQLLKINREPKKEDNYDETAELLSINKMLQDVKITSESESDKLFEFIAEEIRRREILKSTRPFIKIQVKSSFLLAPKVAYIKSEAE